MKTTREVEMMYNETNKNKDYDQDTDIRFIEYKLDTLEKNLREGQQKIEKESQQNYRELLAILQSIQESNATQNQKLIELAEKLKGVEQKIQCIDKLKEVATKHNTEIHELERRLEIYKQVLFVIGTGVAIALVTEVLHLA